jgi:hypothetical protein
MESTKNRRQSVLVGCLGASYLLLCSIAAAYDFKGVAIGQPATPADIQAKLGVKCGVGANNLQVCNGMVTFAGTVAVMNLVIGADGIVQRISLPFASDQFGSVAEAVIEKFGPPKKTTHETEQNQTGATFLNVVHKWTAAGGIEVTLSKFASRVDTSLLYFSTSADREMLEHNRKERAKDL